MTACGLDFGTSNSAIGVARDGRLALAPVEGRSTLVPSAIFFDLEQHGRVLFGQTAIDSYIAGHDGRLMRALKTILGSPLIDEATAVGRRRIKLTEVVELYVRHLKQRAEEFAGCEITQVVHGRPVHFVDGDEAADRRAQSVLEDIARRAGFRDVVFEYEPIAAAYHYEETVAREELVLVADIGGGTSDFSVIRIGPERRTRPDRRADLLSSAGARIGGTDFDTRLSLDTAMPLLGMGTQLATKDLPMPKAIYYELATWATINFAYNYKTEREVRELLAQAVEPKRVSRLLKTIRQRLGHRIALGIEETKVALSDSERASLALDFLAEGLSVEATRDGFESAIADKTAALTKIATSCIADAGVAAGDVQTLFFTGGSSRVPAVREAIRRAAPEASEVGGSDFLSVALGLTREAQRRFG